jgi:flagellar biosynthesis/type III secretory pathway M-ring protein FliF/YscJ
MKDKDFCLMFLYSLINLVCFLLNVIYLTSLFNVRSQTKLLGIDNIKDYDFDDDDFRSDLDIYQNSYTATATLFAFNFLGFLGFMIVLILLINKIKVNRIDNERNNEPEKQLHPYGDDIRTDERIGSIDNTIYTNNNNKQNEEGYEKLIKIMWLFFLFSQLVFLIEIIVITVYHSKSAELESELDYLHYFTKIYRDLIIVGYIFLVIFIIFDLIAAIITFQCGRRVKFISNDQENLNERKFCDCFSDCITNCCEKMADIFNKCERENEDNEDELNKRLENLKKKYEELNEYCDNLRKLNEDIKNKKDIDSINTDLEKLNLPRSETVMITQRIEVTTKK